MKSVIYIIGRTRQTWIYLILCLSEFSTLSQNVNNHQNICDICDKCRINNIYTRINIKIERVSYILIYLDIYCMESEEGIAQR